MCLHVHVRLFLFHLSGWNSIFSDFFAKFNQQLPGLAFFSAQEFCSVGDDSCLILWDARTGSSPAVKVVLLLFNFLCNKGLSLSDNLDVETYHSPIMSNIFCLLW